MRQTAYKLIGGILLLLGAILPALADDDVVVGKVLDEAGKPLTNAKVSVDGSAFFDVDKGGTVSIQLSRKLGRAPEVRVLKKDMRLKDVDFNTTTRELKLVLEPAVNFFQGQVLDAQANPLSRARVQIEGLAQGITTDAYGFFGVTLPTSVQVSKNSKFMINGQAVAEGKATVNQNYNFVVLIGQKPTEAAPVAKDDVSVTVYEESYKPLPNITFTVEGKQYQTDSLGRFLIKSSLVDVGKFSADGYQIATFDFDSEGNYVFIVVKSENSTGQPPVREPMDSLVIDYRKDFYGLINELELRKQSLAERGEKIREEMERIAGKLSSEQNINDQQRNNLTKYLKNLEEALVANDLAYEDAAAKSRKIMDQLKSSLLAKDETIGEIEEDRKDTIFTAYVVSGIALALLVVAILYYRLANKINRQKEQIEAKHQELQQAYSNIKTISNVGQRITSTLDFRSLINSVNTNLSTIIDASVFGVGVVNEAESKIEFMDFIEDGKKQTFHYEKIDDKHKFSVWCIKNQKEVVINDLAQDWKKYLAVGQYQVTPDMPKSLIYLPLMRDNKAIGAVTVQSQKKNAYSEIDLKILQALASYISIALDNSNAYEIIKRKNKDITDSIRYAQTIQDAILPSPKLLHDTLGENFVVYRPKDLVSGDFYWLNRVSPLSPMYSEDHSIFKTAVDKGEQVFFAVGDCTGHGVPGGFMSMIANHLLIELIEVKRITDPAEVLGQLDVRVRQALKQYDKVNDDGMDIGLCQIAKLMDADGNPTGQTRIVFAGARRSLYFYSRRERKLDMVKGDRSSIGGLQRKENAFVNHELVLNQGDLVYMLTDGMADQNNSDRQKFTTRSLHDLLEANAELSLAKQKELIEDSLNEHMKGMEQRDDITIIGIRM
jgi:serine phosphatase RsbU (regulator of sigma subunit)